MEWLRAVGSADGAYPDPLYKTGVELCERYSKNQAVKATFRVIRPTPLHKKLLRNTLKSTALLLERKEEAAVKKKEDRILPPEKPKTKTPAKKPAKSKMTATQKPTQSKKSAKGTRR